MKDSKRKLDLIVRLGIVSLEDFYSSTFSESCISFQGTYRSETIVKYIKRGWKFTVENNGASKAEKKNIEIIFM